MWGYLIFLFLFFLISSDSILLSLVFGSLAAVTCMDTFHTTPYRLLNIQVDDEVTWTFIFFIVLYYVLGKIKSNLKSKEKEDEDFSDIDCPLEIVAFGSRNNIFTAGNNSIIFKVRNNSDYPMLFNVKLLVGDKWVPSGYNEFEIGPKKIETYRILGPAWRRAKDIKISHCR
jgi:hypothetical protein